jgi:arsenite/tail-anchored protein-transporting ATPase
MSARWLEGVSTRNVFFTGKGGVGKTSLACAAALEFASQGLRTLIVSTDPASNLDDVLGEELGSEPMPIPEAENLFGMNIDPEAAAKRYRERAIGPYRHLLPAATIRSMEEGLSGACTTEIAAFDEFTELLGGGNFDEEFDRIVFDTAPTGHTLRLLSLPAAWSGFIESNTSGVSCLGPLSALQKQEEIYKASVAALKDPSQTTLMLVARADGPSLREAGRAAHELQEIGVSSMRLIVNGVFRPAYEGDPVANALAARGLDALAAMPDALADLPMATVPLMPTNMVGVDAIRLLLGDVPPDLLYVCGFPPVVGESFESLIDGIAAQGHGVVMTMGKGGVGKTSVAAAVAVALASRGHQVLLTTTDPAAHVADAATNRPPTLRVERIDPVAEVARYTEQVLSGASHELDAEGRALLEEDLRSPCTEEIAVFRAFAEVVSRGEREFVVLDTAPTGHTVLLLDAAEAYHRDVLRSTTEMPDSVRNLLPRLRDKEYTKVLIVTLPEPTPVLEAQKLQTDLWRAGIKPYAWVANASLALAGSTDPLLQCRAAQEAGWMQEVRELSKRWVALPWVADPTTLGTHGNPPSTADQ